MKEILNRVNQGFILIGSGILFGMMTLGVANIIFRAFGHPIKGTFELMGFGGALVVGLSLGGTQQKRGHIEVNLFRDKWPSFLRSLMEVMSSVLSIFFWGLITYKLFQLALVIKDSGELSETLNIPYYPLIFLVAVGVGFMLVILISQGIYSAKKAKRSR